MTDILNNNLNRVFSNSIPDTVMYHPKIMLLDLRIYSIIKSFMDTHNTCFPSNKWISKKLDCHEISVPRAITKLESLGFIERIEIKGQRYLVTKQYPTALKQSEEDQNKQDNTNTDVNPTVDNIDGVNLQVKGGLTQKLRGVNPQVNHNRSKSSGSKSKIDSIGIRSDFNEQEQIVRDMVVTKIGDDSFTYRQAAFLLSLSTNDGKKVTVDGIAEALYNYVDFLLNNKTGRTVRNKVAYFIKAMKTDGHFVNQKQFTKIQDATKRRDEENQLNAEMDLESTIALSIVSNTQTKNFEQIQAEFEAEYGCKVDEL